MERSVKGRAKLGDANGSKEQQIVKRLCVSKLGGFACKEDCFIATYEATSPLYILPLLLYSWILVYMGFSSILEP